MNQYETLRIKQQGNVVTAFLDRGDGRNSINMRMVRDLSNLIDTVEEASDVAVLVLRGNTDVFTCGIDLQDFPVEKPRDIYGLQKWERMCREMERMNKFTVAAVQGECTGGGLQLVLLCDARIAESRAVFRLDEVEKGFLPGMATFRLAKYIGLGRAKNLILTGRSIRAPEALDWGILDQVCEQAEFEETLQRTIGSLLPFHPVALEMARRLLSESYAVSYEDFLGHYLAAQHRCIHSEAFRRLIEKAGRKNDA
jgi:enoyl-CoA hydratase